MNAESHAEQSPPGTRAAPQQNGALVLVVESDTRLREQLCSELRTSANEIQPLRDGAALLEYFQMAGFGLELVPDVIVAGVSDPASKVVDACEQLHRKGMTVPIVLLSGVHSPDSVDAVERAGADFIFEQPLEFESVRSTISSLALACHPA